MLGVVKLQVDLVCPGCGKTGTGIVTTRGPGNLRAISSASGFVIRLAGSAMQIACSTYGATTYEAK